jgi:hypothetical protein
VYTIGIDAEKVVPQGVKTSPLSTHEALHSKAWDLWLVQTALAEKIVRAPAFVVSTQIGVDAFVVCTQHPDAGVLRMTVISIEPN